MIDYEYVLDMYHEETYEELSVIGQVFTWIEEYVQEYEMAWRAEYVPVYEWITVYDRFWNEWQQLVEVLEWVEWPVWIENWVWVERHISVEQDVDTLQHIFRTVPQSLAGNLEIEGILHVHDPQQLISQVVSFGRHMERTGQAEFEPIEAVFDRILLSHLRFDDWHFPSHQRR